MYLHETVTEAVDRTSLSLTAHNKARKSRPCADHATVQKTLCFLCEHFASKVSAEERGRRSGAGE